MKKSPIYRAIFLFFLALTGLSANPVTLQTNTYNFQLPGGGGGIQGTLNGQPQELFCDDFANEIHVPATYSANVTILSTTANLSDTRFGELDPTDWTTITLTGGTMAQDDFFNSGVGTEAIVRYALVAYLVSQYNVGVGVTAANDELQKAIWTLMDPSGETINISGYPSDVSSDLLAAENWYLGIETNTSALNAFLMKFEVVSDSTMTGSRTGLGVGGFQEQIVETPEPRAIWSLICLLCIAAFLVRRHRSRSAGVHRAALAA
jgi:hypothetical protein